MRRLARLAFSLSVVGVVGCADGGDFDDTSLPCPPTQYSCDITDEACAAGVLDLTACIRGDDVPELPKINRLTAREFGEQLRVEAEEDDNGPSPWDPVLVALGLLPAGKGLVEASIAEAVDSVAAFYDSETKEVSIITDAGSEDADARERMYLLSHEFTHLLQDRAHDLEKLSDEASSSTDRRLSLSMLVEGEAVVTSTRALLRLVRRSPDDFNFPNFFDTLDESLLEGVGQASAPLAAALQSMPYNVGGRYVAKLGERSGWDAVKKLYDTTPPTAADWLALDTAHPGDSRAEPLDCAPPLPPDGFELYDLDHFGAAGVLAMLASIDKTELELPGELAADAFALYVEQGDTDPARARVIGVWRLRFRSAAASDRFYKLFEKRDIGLRRVGSELLIRVSSGSASTLLQDSELEACPSLEELDPKHPTGSQPNPVRKITRLWH
ncbi:MAG TPA: hypothetical protein VJV78_40320 [Polyangiales bacterium]|nr:hypothetical protein [Polyangiales bacterium]